MRAAILVAALGICIGASAILARRPPALDPAGKERDAVSERLRAFDASQRISADFAHLPTWDKLSGPEPYVVALVPRSQKLVGILRGADAIVVLDDAMHERERLAAPTAPVALAVSDDGALYVAGELASTVARFTWEDGKLEPAGIWELDGIRAVRAIAAGVGGWIYVAEESEGRLIALQLDDGVTKSAHAARGESARQLANNGTPNGTAIGVTAKWNRQTEEDRIALRREIGSCRGPNRALRVADRLVVNCVLDHALVVHRLEPSGAPSGEVPVILRHDGPIWGFDAVATDDGLRIAAGGVEDHPLDRTIGAFGYIDSFLFLYRIGRGASSEAVREATLNLSELGVVTPKAVALRDKGLVVTVAGYGSEKLVEFSFPAGPASPPVLRARDFVPGASAVAPLEDGRLVFADPLLDAWIIADGAAPPTVVSVRAGHDDASRDPLLRLGEALFFTTLMSPFNRADGALSRFTCETCHFEGYVDGRVHHTGRDDVHAVTKPLLGLFNNRPHFSRALDPDLTAVVFNEFRVAGAKSGHDPWFSLAVSDAPWVRFLGWSEDVITPEAMRKALMRFLIAFQHRPNPAVLGRSTFSEIERRGAALFRERCEGCHEARLASDQPATRVPFEQWEQSIIAREGAIVWGKDVYERTGVLPYVHEKGARVPSLRRLYKKHPYFTNGSADSLEDVLARARFLASGFRHDVSANEAGARNEVAASEPSLDTPSRAALLAFIELL